MKLTKIYGEDDSSNELLSKQIEDVSLKCYKKKEKNLEAGLPASFFTENRPKRDGLVEQPNIGSYTAL